MPLESAVLALLVSGLGSGLVLVAETLLKKGIVEPALDKGLEPLRSLVTRGYDRKKDEEALRGAILGALKEATGSDEADQWDRWLLTLRLTDLDENTRALVAVAAVEMVEAEPKRVPESLMAALGLPEERRDALARFLYILRGKLLNVADYGEVIGYADALASRNALEGLFGLVAGVVAQTEAGAALRVVPVAPSARELEAAYLDHVKNRFRGLPLLGRDIAEASAVGASQAMRLEKVYIELSTTGRRQLPSEMQEEGTPRESVSQRAQAEEAKPASALREVMEHRALVLLGDPGSGKSTFARHLALCLAGARAASGNGWLKRLKAHDVENWLLGPFLPVFVRLGRWAESGLLPEDPKAPGESAHLLSYLGQYLEEQKLLRGEGDLVHHLRELFQTGEALLIADGLDEVPEQRRRQVAESLHQFAQTDFPQVHVLVTCRVRQYPMKDGLPQARWGLGGFRVAQLADFDPGQIRSFIDQWFEELAERRRMPPAQAQDRKATLTAAVRQRPELAEVAPRPIVLTQMAIVHADRELPDSMVEVYRECCDLLLWRWESLRGGRQDQRLGIEVFLKDLGVHGLKPSDIEKALDRAIFQAHEGGEAEVPDSRLKEALETAAQNAGAGEDKAPEAARRFLRDWLASRNGLLLPAGEDTWDAPHKSFREFMAARHLIGHTEVTEEGRRRIFVDIGPPLFREDPDRWPEVFRFAIGLAGGATAIDALNRLYPDAEPVAPEDLDGRLRLLYVAECAPVGGLAALRGDDIGVQLLGRLEAHLKAAMQDALLSPKDRYDAGERLDALEWLPEDLYAFVRVPIPVPARGCPSEVWIGRYPVTNAQYERFLRAEDFNDPDLWTGFPRFDERGRSMEGDWEDAGSRWLRAEGRGQGKSGDEVLPRYWDELRIGVRRRGYPVVGVTWYEANAYCRWLLRRWEELEEATANPELHPGEVRLPTEGEWVEAAGGKTPEGRYPWDPPDEVTSEGTAIADRANVWDAGLRGTSPVAMYLQGTSRPHGLVDLAGNVWEWQANFADEDHDLLALRGGSWSTDLRYARVAVRLVDSPGRDWHAYGVRVLVVPG